MLRYARKLTVDASSIDESDVFRLSETGFSDRAIVEINVAAAYMNFVNRIAQSLGVELEEAEDLIAVFRVDLILPPQCRVSPADSQFFSELLFIEPHDDCVVNLRDRCGHHVHLPQLIERSWIGGNVPILEWNAVLRKELFRRLTENSTGL